MIGIADLRLRDEVRIGGNGPKERGRGAAAEQRLAAAAVCRTRRCYRQSRYASIENPGVGAENALAVAARVPGKSESRLEHFLVGWNLAVRGELDPLRRLAVEAGVEHLIGRR